MGTVLESSRLGLPALTRGSTRTALARTAPVAAIPNAAWLTATIRPAGTFGRNEVIRLRALLDALSACASFVVLDLQAARLCSPRAGEVIQEAARDIERRGGCLMCIHVDAGSRACLSRAGDRVVLMDDTARSVVLG